MDDLKSSHKSRGQVAIREAVKHDVCAVCGSPDTLRPLLGEFLSCKDEARERIVGPIKIGNLVHYI